jgi:hypothetical protein
MPSGNLDDPTSHFGGASGGLPALPLGSLYRLCGYNFFVKNVVIFIVVWYNSSVKEVMKMVSLVFLSHVVRMMINEEGGISFPSFSI